MKMVFVGLFALALVLPSEQAPPVRPSDLKIVVLKGEDAVNIIQQKTAVAPVVEVRDRNNLPVPGAVVTFAVQGGKAAAFAGGVPTMTVTTNAAGQAVAAGFSPLASGAVQINVQAVFQGQTIAATIAQTNVMTAAQAAAAAGASGAGTGSTGAGTAAGGAAGGGGGISGATIGIIGAAVAGGAVAATQLGGDSGTGDSGIFAGAFSTEMVFTFSDGRGGTCSRVERHSGTLRMELETVSKTLTGDSTLTASTARIDNGVVTIVSNGCQGGLQPGQTEIWGTPLMPVTGSVANLGFSVRTSRTSTNPIDFPGTTVTELFEFSGSATIQAVTGTFGHTTTIAAPGFPSITGRYSIPVTLPHQ